MVEEAGKAYSIHIEDNVEEVESDDIYVGMIFDDENEAYDTYNSYMSLKGFENS